MGASLFHSGLLVPSIVTVRFLPAWRSDLDYYQLMRPSSFTRAAFQFQGGFTFFDLHLAGISVYCAPWIRVNVGPSRTFLMCTEPKLPRFRPPCWGGIGLRGVEDLASSAYLAPAYLVMHLVDKLLPPIAMTSFDESLSAALSHWTSLGDVAPPSLALWLMQHA